LVGCAHTPNQAAPTIRNLVQVDDGLYRGAQPSADGMRQLASMGIKTIVDLRRYSRDMDEERRLAEQLGIRWVSLPVWVWSRPSEAQMREFLAIAGDPSQRPVFVHCRLGRNRTGVMAALYRIAMQGWTPSRAYEEGRQLGLTPWNPVARCAVLRDIPRWFPDALAPPTQNQP